MMSSVLEYCLFLFAIFLTLLKTHFLLGDLKCSPPREIDSQRIRKTCQLNFVDAQTL